MPASLVSGGQGRKVPILAKVGYAFGAIGGQIFRDTPALILPIYMITVLGIPAWMAGIAILIPKAWIIFCDPLVGGWSDRRNATWGRAPFLLAGALLSGLTFMLMFSVPDFARPWQSAAYMTLTFAIASTAYSLFSVPYLSVAAELSADPRERTRVLAMRIGFLAIGVAVGAGYALPVARALGEGWTGFNRMGMLYGAICMVTMLITYATVRRLRLITAPSDEAGLDSAARVDGVAIIGPVGMRAVWANRLFVILASSYFVALIAQAMTYTVFGLFFLYVVKDPGQLAIVNVFAALSVLVGQPLAVWLNRFFSKPILFSFGILGWAAMCLSWLVAGPQEHLWLASHGLAVPPFALLAARGFFWGLFNSIYLLMVLSMLTDTIAIDRARTGAIRSGLYAGVFSALEKLAFALGPAITGLILSAGGFVGAKTGEAAAQSAGALTTLNLCFCVYPALLTVVSLLVFSRYRARLSG